MFNFTDLIPPLAQPNPAPAVPSPNPQITSGGQTAEPELPQAPMDSGFRSSNVFELHPWLADMVDQSQKPMLHTAVVQHALMNDKSMGQMLDEAASGAFDQPLTPPQAPPPPDYSAVGPVLQHIQDLLARAQAAPPQYQAPHMNALQGALGALGALLDPRHAAANVGGMLQGMNEGAQQDYKNQMAAYSGGQTELQRQLAGNLDLARSLQERARLPYEDRQRQYELAADAFNCARQQDISRFAQLQSIYENPSSDISTMKNAAAEMARIAGHYPSDLPTPQLDPENDFAGKGLAQAGEAMKEWEKILSDSLDSFGVEDAGDEQMLENKRQALAKLYGHGSPELTQELLGVMPTAPTAESKWGMSPQDRSDFLQQQQNEISDRLSLPDIDPASGSAVAAGVANFREKQLELQRQAQRLAYDSANGDYSNSYAKARDLWNQTQEAKREANQRIMPLVEKYDEELRQMQSQEPDLLIGPDLREIPPTGPKRDAYNRFVELQSARDRLKALMTPESPATDFDLFMQAHGAHPNELAPLQIGGNIGIEPDGSASKQALTGPIPANARTNSVR